MAKNGRSKSSADDLDHFPLWEDRVLKELGHVLRVLADTTCKCGYVLPSPDPREHNINCAFNRALHDADYDVIEEAIRACGFSRELDRG